MDVPSHTYVITQSTSYTFNYFKIKTIQVSDIDNSIEIDIALYHTDKPSPSANELSSIRPINNIRISLTSLQYSSFTPAELYNYLSARLSVL